MQSFIDLHVHMDGSVPLGTAAALAESAGLSLSSDELLRSLQAPESCRNLNEYLSVFQLPLRLLQTEEALEALSLAFHEALEAQGLLYAEPRFAPALHTEKGLTQEKVLEAVLRGRQRFQALHPDASLHSGFLLCAMRGRGEKNEKKNLETIELAAAYLGKGVLGADLAGAEALFPTENFRALFRKASLLSLPFTIHAGEAAGPESIRAALVFSPSRIGHGVRCLEDAALVRELAERKIPLELCPTSNLQTRIFRKYSDYPIRLLLKSGVRATVNTDNMTVSNTTLSEELALLVRHCALTGQELCQLQKNAACAVFSGEAESARLLRRIEECKEAFPE